MGVLANLAHILERNQRVFANRESTYATQVQPTASSAFRVLKGSWKPAIERKDRVDARATRSRLERITGMRKVTWDLESYVIPSAAAGTPPNIGTLLQQWMGTYVNTPSTSDVYSPSDSQTALGSTTITTEYNDIFNVGLIGGVVETGKFSIKGGEEPRVTLTGWASDFILTGNTTLNGGISGGVTSMVVTDADVYEVGSLVTIGTSNGGGNGHRITVKAGTTATFTPSLTGNQSNGAVVAPFAPSESYAGSPLPYVFGTLTLDGGSNFPFTELEIEMANKIKPYDKQALTATVQDYVCDFRDAKGSLSFWARQDQLIWVNHWRNAVSTTHALVASVQPTASATARLVITANNIEMEDPEITPTSGDAALVKIPFVMMGSGSGANELSITFQ
jgi:hypothetical protein